ncbi:acetylcholine receptor subunit beta-like 1 [Haliotis rubra]|uniref:acetylcholine receptor subunit beta-like 1 n=1 Tax=Haliotis rubra TaxID=36100 RepID=UPI001EE61137|nr:acetylcholine receptor subunit beta-like 1 [Haliotis rubra]
MSNSSLSAGAVTSEDLKQLKKEIFDGYDVQIRPVYNQTEAVNVDMRFSLQYIAYLRWYDRILSWNASKYGGLDFITVPQTKIWRPDYVVDNVYVQN